MERKTYDVQISSYYLQRACEPATPAALVNERRPLDPPLEPDGGQHRRSRPESLYWRGESIEGKNKFTNKQEEDERHARRTTERSLVHQDLINMHQRWRPPHQDFTLVSFFVFE